MKTGDPAATIWHVLYVRTAAGEMWEPACQFILSPTLALNVARLLRDYLAGVPAAQKSAPCWAAEIAAAIRDEGDDPAACAVEVWRGTPPKLKRVAWYPALPAAGGGSGAKGTRTRRLRVR